jgi:hypothetical protein
MVTEVTIGGWVARPPEDQPLLRAKVTHEQSAFWPSALKEGRIKSNQNSPLDEFLII